MPVLTDLIPTLPRIVLFAFVGATSVSTLVVLATPGDGRARFVFFYRDADGTRRRNLSVPETYVSAFRTIVG